MALAHAACLSRPWNNTYLADQCSKGHRTAAPFGNQRQPGDSEATDPTTQRDHDLRRELGNDLRQPAQWHQGSFQEAEKTEHEELPELMVAIANASIKRTTRCLIEWQLHTMTRPAEAATTSWADIDLDKRIWTIPAERMKKRRAHVIPLTEHALALLETIKPYSGHREYVFPADRDPRDHCNSQTANMALKRMGFEGRLVSHGMRSMASTILNEQGWDPELIEVALAHVDKDEVRSAYNRADYIERRRPMMIWWSEHIQHASTGSLSVSAIQGTRVLKIVSMR
ncbi:Integrase family protein [Pseudomonas coronafaciens pv. oryzae]|nr:Integrase family protein [Pseudomonas coronafaciens pv. oryzae]RMT01099.1 Integrase protein [Pseudomonas coronafaciens pv. oryzae]